MLPHPLTNFEIHKYYQNETRLNSVYSKNNLSKIKDAGTHWIPLYVNDNNVTYFDSFGVEHIPKEIKKIHRKQKIIPKFNNMLILLYWT